MNRNRPLTCVLLAAVLFLLAVTSAWAQKPKLTLDEFFNWVYFNTVKVSPDGNEVVIVTERPDWKANRFRHDLWLYRVKDETGGSLIQFTRSGNDTNPQWSPDGHWVAFLSDRRGPQADDKTSGAKDVEQLYVISPSGGEAVPLTRGGRSVHAFSWSADSSRLYFATRDPWSKKRKETYKKKWKDVIQYRAGLRGDTIFSLNLRAVLAARMHPNARPADDARPQKLAATPYRVAQIRASPDGRRLAFATDSRSRRMDSLKPYGLYLVDLPGGGVHLLSHTRVVGYQRLHWTPDSRHIFFYVTLGSVKGPYRDTQPRAYWIDADNGEIERWGARFKGSVKSYAAASDGSLVLAGRLGTQVQIYSQTAPAGALSEEPGWPGTYERLSAAAHSSRLAFVYSTLQKPNEVYLADSPRDLSKARPITDFNHLFTERALPRGRTFHWTADDGTPIEGMLIYPPGKFGARHLPMLTLIHGGPEDADGDHFEADWYQWAALAATDGWLVFEPNYRGSTGYGDAFTLAIVPHLVSRPGKDILEGVDALVKAGIANPHRLTIGGYSYGGYMTNWLITQTTRFKAAVTGAGAIEHALNWGNDDMTLDDSYFLGGEPWENEANYNGQAAIWQLNKVRTPTHMVAGADDIRVYVGESYALDRALFRLHVPSKLLIFPGEGHELAHNPWHGKIKVREELKWLEKYGMK